MATQPGWPAKGRVGPRSGLHGCAQRAATIGPREDAVVVDHAVNWTWTGDELEMLRGERLIRGKNARFTGPPIKDLGIDKPKPAAPAAPAPEKPKQP